MLIALDKDALLCYRYYSSFLNCSFFNYLIREVRDVDSGTLALLQFLVRTSQLLDQLLNETAANWQISPSEARILLFLSCSPQLDTAKDVALHCGMSKASVSGNVLKLVTRGLLTAEMDLSDRRFQRLALTEQAEPVVDAIQDAAQRFHDEALGTLSLEDYGHTLRCLTEVVQNLEK